MSIALHRENTGLQEVMTDYDHIPIQSLTYTRNTATGTTSMAVIAFPSCEAYEDACRSGGAKADGGRLLAVMGIGAHRVHDAIDRKGRVLEHHCWPHLDCWGS